MKQVRGFTLVEVMIVGVIVAILAAIAIPQYNDYVIRSRIIEATSGLAGVRVKMEQYFLDNRSYQSGANCGLSNFQTTSFAFSCASASANVYTWTATGSGLMNGFEYTINQNNVKTSKINAGAKWPADAATGARCWILKRGPC